MKGKIKIFIAEDDVFISEQLKEILLSLGYEVTGIGFNTESSVRILRENPPDMAILDIKMHSSDQGFEIASYINDHFDIPYIFLTSFSDHATVFAAIDLNPSAYLLKPFNSGDIFSALEVVKRNFKSRPPEVIIRDGRASIRLSVDEILWVKSDDKYVEIQTTTKRYTQRSSISEFLESIEHAGLTRVHRSYAINVAKVNVIKTNTVVIAGMEIPVSRMHIAKIREIAGQGQ